MFFTPSTICAGGVILDYFSMLMIINELKLDFSLGLWHIDMHLLEYTFFIEEMTSFYLSCQMISLITTRPLIEFCMFDQSSCTLTMEACIVIRPLTPKTVRNVESSRDVSL